MKLQEKYSYYLQHGLNFIVYHHLDQFEGEDFYDDENFGRGAVWKLSGYADKELMIPMGEGEINGFIFSKGSTYINVDVLKLKIRPLLYPLDALIEQVTDWIYIVEPESFDTKESAKSWCEIMFLEPLNLPFNVFNKILSLHGDVFGLIADGFAVSALK